MSALNSDQSYGWVSILLHWSMAVLLITMYLLGDWMVDLDYYNPWYNRAPDIHRASGILLVGLMLLRFAWNRLQSRPAELTDKQLQNRLAHIAHNLFYLLVLLLFISGYLISTAKGKGIEVFQMFTLPALLPENAERGELAGDLHEILANVFLVLALMHAAAALHHHFINKDKTLKRMLGLRKP
ncbi:MAG: cytochrome b [Gammaproteobacteria bacterium]|nr:cytochrome b [Gammaproteobacteria bacterium]